MTLHIISNPHILQRAEQIKKEMVRQGIEDYRLWPSITIAHKPRRTGISLAHKQIVEWALLEQLPEVAIAEDDVWFPASDGWQYFLSKKPKDYDLYLAGITRGDIDSDNFTRRYSGQFCYFIHERFYTTFLRADEGRDIDGAMSDMGEFHVCYPFAAFCYPMFSENQSGVTDYSHLLIGREIYGFGKMKNESDAKLFSSTARSLMV